MEGKNRLQFHLLPNRWISAWCILMSRIHDERISSCQKVIEHWLHLALVLPKTILSRVRLLLLNFHWVLILASVYANAKTRKGTISHILRFFGSPAKDSGVQ
jgi:hypothetical protein